MEQYERGHRVIAVSTCPDCGTSIKNTEPLYDTRLVVTCDNCGKTNYNRSVYTCTVCKKDYCYECGQVNLGVELNPELESPEEDDSIYIYICNQCKETERAKMLIKLDEKLNGLYSDAKATFSVIVGLVREKSVDAR